MDSDDAFEAFIEIENHSESDEKENRPLIIQKTKREQYDLIRKFEQSE